MAAALDVLLETYRAARAELRFLDANLWIGRPRMPEFTAEFDLPSLLGRLRRYQIEGGVASHMAGLQYDPAWANERTLAELAGSGLYAGVTLVPEMFEAPEAGRAYLATLIHGGARLARVFPASHGYSLRPWCSGALLQALADCRLPLVVWHGEASWEEVRGLCEGYPDLPVIVEGTPRKIIYHTRLFYALMDRCPNLHLELHNQVLYLGVEEMVARWGAGRLLFGSYMPIYDPNTTLMQVTHARIAAADKRRIARENLEELMAGVREP